MTTETTTINTTNVSPFSRWVSRNAHVLAEGGVSPDGGHVTGYLKHGAESGRILAALRDACGREPGCDPAIAAWTLPDPEDTTVAGNTRRWDHGATRRETAAHDSLTLYAIHQQSVRDANMHVDEYATVGTAIGRLAAIRGENGARRLLARILNATTHDMLITHLRRLMNQLRRDRIPLNHGLLANDLLAIAYGGDSANRIRARWGRDMQHAYDAIMSERRKAKQNDGE